MICFPETAELTPLMTTTGQCVLTYQTTYRYPLPRFWTCICSTARGWIFGRRRDTGIPLSNATQHLGDHHVDLPVITYTAGSCSYLA